MYNFFDIFNILPKIPIDQEELRQKYFVLQKKYHPDYSNDTKIDISLINKGYSILSDTVLTILYILEINNINISENIADIEFLSQCIEWQENLSDNIDIREPVNSLKQELLNTVIALFSQNKLEESVSFVQKMLYLSKIITV